MPLDPDLQRLIEMIPPVPPGPLDFKEIRQQADALLPVIIGAEGVAQVGSVDERTVKGTSGELPIRIYRPAGAALGTMHYLHGGGWSMGNLAMVDPVARRICRDMSMVVVTSAYRLAPEDPFPAAYEDAIAAAVWVRTHIAELGGEDRPVVIGGDSAGSNLAAAVCIGLRDGDDVRLGLTRAAKGDGAGFDLQLLLYPATDLRASSWDRASRKADADPTLTTASIRAVMEVYATESNRDDWRASPLAAKTLAGLPPAVVVVLQVDPLRDEAIAYADRLKQDGVSVELIEFPHLTHGFAHFAGIVPAAAHALAEVLARMKTKLRDAGHLA